MIIAWIACGLVGAGFFFVVFKLFMMKITIRRLTKQMKMLHHADTNALVTTSTTDNDLITLAVQINAILKKSRRHFLHAQRTETSLNSAIANISHDLRTPLTSAKGYVQMLQKNETPHPYYKIIHERLEALTVLMDSLFDFSQAVETSFTLNCININDVLCQEIANSYPEFEQKGLRVECTMPDAPVYCLCNEEALQRIIQNLLRNAYIHGNDYLHITLDKNSIEFTNHVMDTKNINPLYLFDRFYTVDKSRNNKHTGLGLAIVKELTEKMGGRVTATKDSQSLTIRIVLVEWGTI